MIPALRILSIMRADTFRRVINNRGKQAVGLAMGLTRLRSLSMLLSLLLISADTFARQIWFRHAPTIVLSCYSAEALCARYGGVYHPTASYWGPYPGCIVPDPLYGEVTFPAGTGELLCPEGQYVATADPDGCVLGAFDRNHCQPIDTDCPDGEAFNPGVMRCTAPAAPNPDMGTGSCDPLVGNPINAATGNKYQREVDIAPTGGSSIRFIRYYNGDASSIAHSTIGHKWQHTYSAHLVVANRDGFDGVFVYRATGQGHYFASAAGGYSSESLPDAGLAMLTNGWQLRLSGGDVETYDSKGRLVSVAYPDSPDVALSYDGLGQLTAVTDQFGRQLIIETDAEFRISAVSDATGARWQYRYDVGGNLEAVIYPDATPEETDNPSRTYHYSLNVSAHNQISSSHLVGITDERGNRVATWEYDDVGRAISSVHAENSDSHWLEFNPDGTTTVTDPLGRQRTYGFSTERGISQLATMTGGECSDCGAGATSHQFNNGFVESSTDFRGNVTQYTRDSSGREISRTEASGTPDARTISTMWHADLRKPLTVSKPGQLKTYLYDAQGRVLSSSVQAQP